MPDWPGRYNPPVRRRLFTVASVVSLLLCAALVVVWVRSNKTADFVHWKTASHCFTLSTFRGMILLTRWDRAEHDPMAMRWHETDPAVQFDRVWPDYESAVAKVRRCSPDTSDCAHEDERDGCRTDAALRIDVFGYAGVACDEMGGTKGIHRVGTMCDLPLQPYRQHQRRLPRDVLSVVKEDFVFFAR